MRCPRAIRRNCPRPENYMEGLRLLHDAFIRESMKIISLLAKS
jgi:hypothetical protein